MGLTARTSLRHEMVPLLANLPGKALLQKIFYLRRSFSPRRSLFCDEPSIALAQLVQDLGEQAVLAAEVVKHGDPAPPGRNNHRATNLNCGANRGRAKRRRPGRWIRNRRPRRDGPLDKDVGNMYVS